MDVIHVRRIKGKKKEKSEHGKKFDLFKVMDQGLKLTCSLHSALSVAFFSVL